jgi:DNA-binding MarR family transcriptional regulator
MDFDDHLTSAARLSIIAALARGDILTFTQLREASGLADGNLHVQTQKLADAGYVETLKVKRGKRHLTNFRITQKGLEAVKLHIRKLERILDNRIVIIKPRRPSGQGDGSQVWREQRSE